MEGRLATGSLLFAFLLHMKYMKYVAPPPSASCGVPASSLYLSPKTRNMVQVASCVDKRLPGSVCAPIAAVEAAPLLPQLTRTGSQCLVPLHQRRLPVGDGLSRGYTSGLVQEYDHALLPPVLLVVTFALTLVAMTTALLLPWKQLFLHIRSPDPVVQSPGPLFPVLLVSCSHGMCTRRRSSCPFSRQPCWRSCHLPTLASGRWSPSRTPVPSFP